MPNLRQRLLCIAFVAALTVALPCLVLALLLIIFGETVAGRLAGLSACLGCLVPSTALLALILKRRKRVLMVAGGQGLLGLILLVVCACLSPSGRSTGALQSHYLGTASYRRFSPTNMVPEIDQLMLGGRLIPLADPVIDGEQGKRVRRLFLEVCRESRTDAGFREVGSAMGLTYQDMFTGKRPTGHLYTYIPQSKVNGKRPVILFCHGAMGNFKGYSWVWKRFCDEHGFALVAPSFGAGFWLYQDGYNAIERARQFCVDRPELDEGRIYLAGLSNGGMAVSLGMVKNPNSYKGFIYLSPVILKQQVAAINQIGKPVLVIHGEADRRISLENVEKRVGELLDRGQKLTFKTYPGEDHFLFFSQRESVLEDVAEWIGE